jgi:nitrite reductase/ring-hydroxylating ferredoxin subunit
VWQLACREEELPRVGDYLEYKIGRQSVLIVRSSETDFQAFYNVCPHRGSELRCGVGNTREIRCRYHSWRWNLDGTIKEVPDIEDFSEDLTTPECLNLRQVRLATWAGFIFISLDPQAAPLSEFLDPIPQFLDNYEIGEMRFAFYATIRTPTNWKTALDAFNEVYHSYGVHPQVLSFFDPAREKYEQYGVHSRMGMEFEDWGEPSPRLGIKPDPIVSLQDMLATFTAVGCVTPEDVSAVAKLHASGLREDMSPGSFTVQMLRENAAIRNVDVSKLDDPDLLLNWDWNLFPNLMIAPMSEACFVWRFRPDGDDPDSCLYDMWVLRKFPPHEPSPPIVRLFFERPADMPRSKENLAILQDLANLSNVQRGLHSNGVTHLKCGRSEANIRHFHRVLDRYLHLTNAP